MPHYPRHLETFNYFGRYRYFLTFCTFERNRYFVESLHVALVCDQILRAATEARVALIAYCFMPDHVHLLTEGLCDDADLKMFVARAKQYSGFYFRKRTRQDLWQRYGYERVLRDEEDTPSVVRYILENPVRAGLVSAPGQYPFSGSSMYSMDALLEYAGRTG